MDDGVDKATTDGTVADAALDAADLAQIETKDAEELLRESQRSYRDLFGHAPIGIWVYDFSIAKRHMDELREQGIDDVLAYCQADPSAMMACMSGLRAVDVNGAALEMYGAPSLEVLLTPRPDQMTPEMFEAAQLNIAAIARGETEATFESRSMKVTGEVMDVLIRWRVAAGHEHDYSRVFMFIVDVTQVHESARALQRYESRFRAIFESTPLGIRLYRLEDDGTLRLEACNEACDRLLGIEHAPLIGRAIDDAFPGVAGSELPDRLREVVRTGEPWETEQFSYHDDRIVGYFEVHAFRAEKDMVAVMFEDVTKRREQERELEEYRTELERMVEDRTRELMKVHAERDAVTGIAVRLVEARDPYTAGHQRRVAQLAQEIAVGLELDPAEVDDIMIAAQLHDVGKVSVPSDILSKPGVLTPAEYRLVQEHPETSYQILAAANLGPGVADVVHQHHERLDGSGYPAGLAGDDILFGARILAVADVVEAMVSHRPYRASRGEGAALGEIGRNSGTLYDERVVTCCIGLFARGFEFTDQST